MTRLFAVLFAAFCLSCGFSAAANNTRTAEVRNNSTPSDEQIEATIRTKLAKSKIGKDGFRFKVAHGIVTWEGTTNVVQHKGLATRMARSAGALQVVNNIQVSAAAKAKAGANSGQGFGGENEASTPGNVVARGTAPRRSNKCRAVIGLRVWGRCRCARCNTPPRDEMSATTATTLATRRATPGQTAAKRARGARERLPAPSGRGKVGALGREKCTFA